MKLSKRINLYIYNSIHASNAVMPVIKKMKTGEKKSKDLKKSDERKYKKGKDSDSDGDNYKSSDNDNDIEDGIEDGVPQRDNGGKFDIHKYRKMLGEMFPSKYMNKRIATLENDKKNKHLQALQ